MVSDSIERECWADGNLLYSFDEAGMGCLAGSLFVAGVIFDQGYDFSKLVASGLNDSKKLTEAKRFALADIILKDALLTSCHQVSPQEVDKHTAYHTRFHRASLGVEQAFGQYSNLVVIMDGNVAIKPCPVESRFLIKGDGKCCSIAAASIIAKTNKDKEMLCLDRDYPAYLWKKNKGYGTRDHEEAIRKYGLTEHHRRTYCKKMLPVQNSEGDNSFP